MLAIPTEVEATDENGGGTAQASAFTVEETGERRDDYGGMGETGSDWLVGDEACVFDRGASTHMTPS